jgi:gliding motility-associated-like protein
LIVAADGIADVSQYTYAWYSGGQPVAGAPIIANNFVADNLADGTYTVVVTNNTTGCVSADSYTLQTEPVVPIVSASSEPVTNCDVPNGSLFATVINTVATYNFNWYAGTDTTVAPVFTGQTVDNVSPGLYTVIAVDQTDPGCISLSDTVSIQDLRFLGFDIEIQAVAPLSNCDPANPNGVLSASVNGDVTSHVFEWYLGTDITGTPVANGSVATGLSDTLYTVVARDVITQCENTAEFTLGSEFLPVPVPDAVVTDVTSCVVGNGAIQATVGGNVKDYTFDWYPGVQVSGAPIFTGPDLTGLYGGDQYTVTATSNSTGCTSPGITVTVGENIILPEFEVEIDNATCLDQNGTATIHVSDTANVALIQWSNGVVGSQLSNYPAGIYTVTVTDTLGCSNSQQVEILSEINAYNGVSPNGDGYNDIFHIDCIENFPNNIVYIYNRAGQLVYVEEGYNNNTIFFEGLGNEGIYLSGNELPDGTYYYVVDKRNGSEPLGGYLELLR